VKTIALLSGGLDSTVLVAQLLADTGCEDVMGIGFDYGQRHRIELDRAARIARYFSIPFETVDLTGVGRLLTGSALTDSSVDVPEGHYADDSMRSTVVPNRNAIMLMVAVGVAAARGFHRVATAVHAGDHPVYPDCRPEFVAAIDVAAELATADGHGDVHIVAPFVAMSKAAIVSRGAALNAPFGLTWSCYQGGAINPGGAGAMHCGACGTCVERQEAFRLAGYTDPTRYVGQRYIGDPSAHA
jgi:7-cyano-7-deazaguanine synthase